MAFTADLTTDIGKVRLLLHDMDPDAPIFPDDDQIQAFLDLEGGEIKQAAALGLESIAGNRAMVMQVVTLLDLKTDGLSTAKALLAVAEQYRNVPDLDWSGFDFADVIDNSVFQEREYFRKLLLAASV